MKAPPSTGLYGYYSPSVTITYTPTEICMNVADHQYEPTRIRGSTNIYKAVYTPLIILYLFSDLQICPLNVCVYFYGWSHCFKNLECHPLLRGPRLGSCRNQCSVATFLRWVPGASPGEMAAVVGSFLLLRRESALRQKRDGAGYQQHWDPTLPPFIMLAET